MQLRGLDPVAAMARREDAWGKLLVEFVRCFLLAYVVARFVILLGLTTLFRRRALRSLLVDRVFR